MGLLDTAPCHAWGCQALICLLCLVSVTGQDQARQLHARRALEQPSNNNGLSAGVLTSKYYNNVELAAKMHEIANSCGGVGRVVKWGRSAKGQDLLALEVYGGGQDERYRPTFKFVGNLHGDEPSGRQLLLALADHLCKAREAQNHEVVQLLQSVSMFMIPTANPDGWDAHSRENSHTADLNRNYPDPWIHKGHDIRKPLGTEEPETLAMMNITLSRRFVGSVALHEGALVANYPFDGYQDGSHSLKGVQHTSPDHVTFLHLATRYAQLHKTMSRSQEFPGGVTNGANWYPVYGGMQDWNYLAAGCMEITLELDNVKTPSVTRLAQMWEENREVFVKYPAEMVLGGLRGFIYTSNRSPLVATLHVLGQGLNVTSAPTGDFFRPLAPGHYNVLIQAVGHHPLAADVDVPSGGRGIVRDFILTPLQPPQPPPQPPQPAATAGHKPHGHQPHGGAQATPSGSAAGGDQYKVDVYVKPQGTAALSWVAVFVYVVAGPMVVVLAVLAWRSAHVRRLMEPAYAMVGLSSRPWAREHAGGHGAGAEP